MPSLSSDILNDAAQWRVHVPDYDTTLTVVGGGAASDGLAAKAGILGLSANSPVLLAACFANTRDSITVLHTPSIFPGALPTPHPLTT